jgi:uncharacterized protein (DUF2236 family)
MAASPIARRINGERITVLSWGRAILMQIAHPLIAAGVAEHSGFRSHALGPVRRLHGTVRAMLALTFGDDAQADRAARGILAIHDRVAGRLPVPVGAYPAGTPYSAHDPDLLLWVHVTLMDSMLLFYERLVAPLDRVERDAYLADAADGVRRIGLPADRAPRDVETLASHLEQAMASGRLAVSPQARELADAILRPAFGFLAWPAVRAQAALTIGTLPPAIRGMYGFAWPAVQERRLATAVDILSRARRIAPDRIARFGAARQP